MNYTQLYDEHIRLNAKMVDFAGWSMPIHYGSQLEEHEAVRKSAGLFDVSHMAVIDLVGEGVIPFLRMLLANNIDKLYPGKALYSCMLNEAGGILDDLIVYKINDNFFRLVVNAGTRDKDLAWINKQAQPFDITVTERKDLGIIASQGPEALAKIVHRFPQLQEISDLKNFHFKIINPADLGLSATEDILIARTGYTGEDGFEWIIPVDICQSIWRSLLEESFTPCGLGARDTLRLEAGLNLYGLDMDEAVTPLESNLLWTVALEPSERQFIGRASLEKQISEGVQHDLVGLLLQQGIPRSHHKVFIEGDGQGQVTSGSFSPTLKCGIALARIPAGSFNQCRVEIRNKHYEATIVKPPFVRNGKNVLSKRI